MIAASKILNIPLIVTEHYPIGALGHTCKELDVSSAQIFTKTRFSMLIDPVKEQLRDREIETVVLFGIESHVCVLHTALELRKQEFSVYVLLDGVSSFNEQERKIAYDRMRSQGIVLTTSESILFELLTDASHPKFKSISELIKETRVSTRQALEALT